MDSVTFEVHDAQRLILEAAQRFIVLCCGRRFGKDHLAAIKLTAHSLSMESPRGGKRYAWINPSYNPQGKESYRVCKMFLQSGGLLKKSIDTPPMELHLTNGDIIYFFTMESEQHLRGGQFDGIVINEAGIIARLFQLWYEIFAPMILDRAGFAWIMGTPKGKNDFFKFFNKGINPDPDWKSFRFPTHANPFINKAELERLRTDMPEELYRQEILADFLESGGAVFRGLAAMAERSRPLKLLPQADGCRVGIDLAKTRDFTCLIALSPDNKVVGFDRFNQLDWTVQQQRIRAFCARYRGKVAMDTTGLGDPIFSALTQLGLVIEPVKLTNERKKQLVQGLQLGIEDGVISIPLPGGTDPARDTASLWHELDVFTYDMTASGAIRYEAPTGEHDDCVTALYLAYAILPPQVMSGLDMADLSVMLEPGESMMEIGGRGLNSDFMARGLY